MKKDILNILILAAAMLFIILSCSSCRTVKKHKSAEKQESTSVASHASDSGAVSKTVDSVIKKKGSAYLSSKTEKKSKGVKVNFEADTSKGPTKTTIENIGGKLIITTEGVKPTSIDAESHELNQSDDSSVTSDYGKEFHSNYDSGYVSQQGKDSSHTEISKSESDIKSSRFALVPILIIIVIVACLYVAYKRYFS